MSVKIDRLKENVPYRIPRHVCRTSKKEKSTFIDRNAISKIKVDLGHYDYEELQKDKESKQKKKTFPN